MQTRLDWLVWPLLGGTIFQHSNTLVAYTQFPETDVISNIRANNPEPSTATCTFIYLIIFTVYTPPKSTKEEAS